MKKGILLSCTWLLFSLASAQSTWLKIMPGEKGHSSYIVNDTIVSFSVINKYNITQAPKIGISMNKLNLKDGSLHAADSFYHFSENLKRNTYLDLQSRSNTLLQNDGNFVVGGTIYDSTKMGWSNQSALIEFPSFNKLSIQLNQNAKNTFIEGMYNINERQYIALSKYDNSNILNSSVTKINPDQSTSVVFRYDNSVLHQFKINEILADNQNKDNLLVSALESRKQWRNGCADAFFWEPEITKIDTTGKILWCSHPTAIQDSTNPEGFQSIQLPNGNILCSWLNWDLRPIPNPDFTYWHLDNNKNASIWFAEIDGKTGKRLWIKTIFDYLLWKCTPSPINGKPETLWLLWSDVKIANNHVVWTGSRPISVNLRNQWKYVPVVLKTDFLGNPVWYREFDFAPKDTQDKGFVPESMNITPDKGFLLTGHLKKQFTENKNGGAWMNAALLKLDSNGCFTPGCNAYDNVIKIVAPKQLCNVFPNPASQTISINYPEKIKDNWEISVFDNAGKLVFKTAESLSQIPCSQFPSGNYFIQLINPKSQNHETHQIVVQH